jgi:hypothetical protein
MFDWRSRPLAKRLASSLGGEVDSCFASLGPLWRVARHCVTANYKGMTLKIYVRAPQTHVWIENFRMRGNAETIFAVNQPDNVMGLHHAVAGALTDHAARVFARSDADEAGVRDFFRDPDNERDIAALCLTKSESMLVNAWQIILRSKTHDSRAILERLDVLGRLVQRHLGGARGARVPG